MASAELVCFSVQQFKIHISTSKRILG